MPVSDIGGKALTYSMDEREKQVRPKYIPPSIRNTKVWRLLRQLQDSQGWLEFGDLH